MYDWDRCPVPGSLSEFGGVSWTGVPKNSGVWRFWPLLRFGSPESLMSIDEGNTICQRADQLGSQVGMKAGNLYLQYEGFNPSGSFKDNGMAACLTHARTVGAEHAACASTGNTSASLSLFASVTGHFKAIVFVGAGKIAFGKLSQALDYGATTLQIRGDFDDAMKQVQQVCSREAIYLVNSLNPFRMEGQKTIIFRILQSLDWIVPDWIVVPGGNLGNASSFGKALQELKQLNLIDRLPRLAVINASGAATLHGLYNDRNVRWNNGHVDQEQITDYYGEMDDSKARAKTVASAIEINRPVNLLKCLRALEVCDGVVTTVTDQEIVDAKAMIAQNGYGCEPASAASVAGTQKLVSDGIIDPHSRVVCILTGHQLKDPDVTVRYHMGDQEKFDQKFKGYGVTSHSFQNAPVEVDNDIDAIVDALENQSESMPTGKS